jgi:Rrf2 family protein
MVYGVSRASQYAIRTLVFLARQRGDVVIPVREIADEEAIPHHFLAKLAGTLVQAGLLEAFKGPGGGLRLAVAPGGISVSRVVEVIDGAGFFDGCFLGLPECGDEDPCPMHEEWKELRSRLIDGLEQLTIGDLARKYADQ